MDMKLKADDSPMRGIRPASSSKVNFNPITPRGSPPAAAQHSHFVSVKSAGLMFNGSPLAAAAAACGWYHA